MGLLMSSFLAAEAGTTVTIPAWVGVLLSVIISTAITSIVGYLIKRSLDNFYKRKEEEDRKHQADLIELEEHRSEERAEKRRQDMKDIVKSELAPVNEKIDSLIDKVTKTEGGTLSSLRNDILTCYYRCREKGYRGDWDFENIHHLYDAYAELHGNSFVKDIMARFDELPSKEEYFEDIKIDSKDKTKK